MPENETLNPDSITARRSVPLLDRLKRGESLNDIFPELESHFYTSLRRFWEQLQKRGVEPAALLDAAVNHPERLHELVRKAGSDTYAKLLDDFIASERDPNLEETLRGWLDAVWDHFRGELDLDDPRRVYQPTSRIE